MLKKIIHEPLVHFLFAGFLLFVYFKSCSNDTGLENTIVVNKEHLLNFMQFQSKAFNQEVFDAKLEEFSEKEKEQLIENYSRDEALYREALQLGLDQNDFVIKRRIIQKLEFILDDFDETTVVFEKDSLEDYFQKHQERYFQAAQFTFTHIFFKNNENDNALDRAKSFMENPAHQKLGINESLQYGDRFLYHRNYAQKTTDFLEGQFGAIFTQALAKLPMNSQQWQGPIPSEHGQHWVKLSHQSESEVPDFAKIYPIVKSDYLGFLKQQYKEQQIQKIVQKYHVKVNL